MEEMDVLRIKTKLIRNTISKILEVTLKEKIGHDINIQINEAEATNNDGRTHVHLSIDAEMGTVELKEMLGI